MKRAKKDMVVFGAALVVAMLLSAVTVVAQVHNESLMNYIEESQPEDYENVYEIDSEKIEDLQDYAADFFNGIDSDFRDFYETSDKVVALNNSLTTLINEIWDTCEEYMWYLEDEIWTEDEFMENAGYYIVNEFVEFFQTDQTITSLINDDYMVYLQGLFEEGVNEIIDETTVSTEDLQFKNCNLLEASSEALLNIIETIGAGDNSDLGDLLIEEEMESSIQSLGDDDFVLCPLTVLLCAILFACCFILFGERGELSQICTYMICLTIVAGPVLVNDVIFITIFVGIVVTGICLIIFLDLLTLAEGHGLFGLVIIITEATLYVLSAPLRWVAILFFAFLLELALFGTGYYIDLMDMQVRIAYEWALEWYQSWMNVGVPQESQELEEVERVRVIGVVENLLYIFSKLLNRVKPFIS